MNKALDIAAGHWGKIVEKNTFRMKYFQNKTVLTHINMLTCGKRINGEGRGVTELLVERGGRSFERAISVGCGGATKEILLLQANIIGHFDLYEISQARVDQALRNAAEKDVADRVDIKCADVFSADIPPDTYDVVHWAMSFHHMPNAYLAMEWSRRVLKKGGWLYFYEYIGPKHFQWTDDQLAIANSIRYMLPERWFIDPRDEKNIFPRTVRRPPLRAFVNRDPSEACDSDSILPALRCFFPNSEPKELGGLLYTVALDPLYGAIDDDALLINILDLDETLAKRDLSLYVAAVVQKI